jgi:hypothetical protein
MSTSNKNGSDSTTKITITFVPPAAVADMIYAALAADPHIDPAEALSEFGQLKVIAGKYDEATALYLTAIAIATKVAGSDHPVVKLTKKRLAGLMRMTGNAEQADALSPPDAGEDTTPRGNKNSSAN